MDARGLKDCPCGETPNELLIIDAHCAKWAYVCGGCCNEWSVEFKTHYYDLESDKAYELALEAWNDAPRGLDNESS